MRSSRNTLTKLHRKFKGTETRVHGTQTQPEEAERLAVRTGRDANTRSEWAWMPLYVPLPGTKQQPHLPHSLLSRCGHPHPCCWWPPFMMIHHRRTRNPQGTASCEDGHAHAHTHTCKKQNKNTNKCAVVSWDCILKEREEKHPGSWAANVQFWVKIPSAGKHCP